MFRYRCSKQQIANGTLEVVPAIILYNDFLGSFLALFPECSGTKVSYWVSVSTFQLPITEQIALNQIYWHGLFFVILVQCDYRIKTRLCIKWWQTTWILLVMCSPVASHMLLNSWLAACWRAPLTSDHKGKIRKLVGLNKKHNNQKHYPIQVLAALELSAKCFSL